ncbi:uncharacterized protein LOC131693955 [Topomyia yanbarensis]|uniref:uncharacterized protein LOC131693955 n=1 Tax=Topomyia yanbarensis TaxID=2498891 RepID=UPI00273C855A|nr:uncharacterized protein LOC131693955 [Topomyia yanbarensis]
MHSAISILTLTLLPVSLCLSTDESGEKFSPEEKEAIQRLKTQFDDACLRNSGSNVTYDEVMEAVALTPACVSSKISVEELFGDWLELNNDTRVAFFSKYCSPVKSSVVECLKPVESLALQCVRPEGQRVEAPDFPLYILPQVVDLLCEDYGAILFANNVVSPIECFQNYYSYIQSCMKNFVSETNAKVRGDYGEVECNVLKSARDCVAEKVDACGNRDLIRIFDLPYQAVIRETFCKNMI